MAYYYRPNHFNYEIGDDVIRWVVKNEDGSLDIHSTSGEQPPNAICSAHDSWTVNTISEDSGVVFLDPVKVREIKKILDNQARIRAYEIHKMKMRDLRAKLWPLYYVLVFALGLWVGHKLGSLFLPSL